MKRYLLKSAFNKYGSALICGLFLSMFLSNCGSSTSNEPDFSAVPHAAALPTTELSSEDKTKLLEAAGKTINSITSGDLQNMFGASHEQLYIYAFWNKDCDACFTNIEHLTSLYSNMAENKIRIITINADDNTQDVNLVTRSKNIAFETYKLESTDKEWMKVIDDNWTGDLPAIFMVNKSEDLFLKYYIPMDLNQLEAIIQTLII